MLLLSSQNHASGINLQCARHVLILHPYGPEGGLQGAATPASHLAEARSYEEQAVGRVHRYPQQQTVYAHRLCVVGTLEERLYSEWGLI